MQIEQKDWQEWNMMFRMLIQVTCGYVSPNMRQVGLCKEGNEWIVEVVLEAENEEDREEAEDFASELSILSEDNAEGMVRARIIVEDGPSERLPTFKGFAGALYKRKEPFS